MGRQIIFAQAFPSPVPYAHKPHVLSAKNLSVFLRENYVWPKYSDWYSHGNVHTDSETCIFQT